MTLGSYRGAPGCTPTRPRGPGCTRIPSRVMTEADDVPPPLHELPRVPGYIWEKLAADVERRIKSGEWSYGDRLPSRDYLAAEYGVGERTVRHSMQHLEQLGLVEILPAKGVYVVWRPGHRSGTR
jgi:GntR family transcriptional regulator